MKKAAVRALLVLYSAVVLYGADASHNANCMREPEGLITLFSLLREATEGSIRDEADQKIDWLLIRLILKLLFVLCFNGLT